MIPAETVTRIWQQMAQISPAEVSRLVEQLKDEQPLILGHLLFLDDFPFTQYEKEIVFYVGMVAWQMIRQSEQRLRKVTRKALERAEKANYSLLETMDSDTEADFASATVELVEEYPEVEVLHYIVEAITEEEADSGEPPIRDEYRGLAFVHLKIALDALVASLG